ncbi:hypothetical protein DPMN_095905 [Dreissena polymorpha]|uniref:Uncharacterized protein n=1 Tax=Dreissena polymorpha TaxID=45954 RepID=A0A9D4R499_DREPO|nr:hypothetical protein DPMN_095905 [Dreissena polymorpha]
MLCVHGDHPCITSCCVYRETTLALHHAVCTGKPPLHYIMLCVQGDHPCITSCCVYRETTLALQLFHRLS